MSIELVMPSNHLILCCPLLLLPSNFPSIKVYSNELALRIRWPKYWSFRFSISPSSEHSGLISFSFDCFDLLVVQGTLKGLLHWWAAFYGVSQSQTRLKQLRSSSVLGKCPKSPQMVIAAMKLKDTYSLEGTL